MDPNREAIIPQMDETKHEEDLENEYSNTTDTETDRTDNLEGADAKKSASSLPDTTTDTEMDEWEHEEDLDDGYSSTTDTEADRTDNLEGIDEERSASSSLDRSTASGQSSKTRTTKEDRRRLRQIFARPKYAEPRHPIFSSPFARRISIKAFGPIKPKWYKSLTTAQLYIFKDIMNYVEVGREGNFRFEEFCEALHDFEPSITRTEVLEIFDSLDRNEFEELDFGKVLFLLAYRDKSGEDYPESIEEKLASRPITPRQSLLLSAIAYFVLIATPEEIERYYFQNTKRKATVLRHHLESARLEGLTGKQMESKQLKAAKNLGPLYFLTGSPYALPVPFVPSSKQPERYQDWKKKNSFSSKSDVPCGEKQSVRPIVPLKLRRELGERTPRTSEEEKIISQINYGRIPLPEMRFPADKIQKLRTGDYTIELKDYIMQKAYEARERFRDRLKEAAILYARQNLKNILRKGFPTEKERDNFIELYQRYHPLNSSDIGGCSLWVKPAGYRVKHDEEALSPEKFAFGSTIPNNT